MLECYLNPRVESDAWDGRTHTLLVGMWLENGVFVAVRVPTCPKVNLSRSRFKPQSLTQSPRFLPPPITDGHLYYVRLRTEIGLVYKLGFTTLPSLEERLAFKGDGAEQLVDKVLYFEHLKDAWNIEQELHTLLAPRKLFSCGTWQFMPLYKNGQSELYGEDVLQLDKSYTKKQSEDVQDNIIFKDIMFSGRRNATEVRAEIDASRAKERAREEARAVYLASRAAYRPGLGMRILAFVFKPLTFRLARAYGALVKEGEFEPPEVKRVRERIEELRGDLIGHRYASNQRKLAALRVAMAADVHS
jgi:hypothetical protein